MKNAFEKSLLGASVLALLVASPSFAQNASEQDKKKEEEKAKSSETVVITGSRIKKNEYNQASPLQVITNANALLAGKNDPVKVLQSSTAAASSNQINNFYSGFVVEGGPGIQSVGLNSLGSQRTLLLLNGRRLPPSGTRGQVGAVDLQTIPNLAVDRYEILNEGASPIYGSDAVGGVINMVTRKNTNGLEITGSTGTSFEGGGSFNTVGAVWGKTADKWNVMVSAEYQEQKSLKYSDRDFCREDYVFNPTTGARVDFIDPSTGNYYCLGVNGTSFNRVSPTGSASSGTGTWVVDPTATARVIGTNPQTGAANTLLKVPGFKRLFSPPTGTQGTPITYQLDYTNPLYAASDIISPSKRTNLYSTFSRDLDIFGGVEVYGEALYAKRESSQERGAQLFFVIPATNPFNPWGTAFGGTAAAQPVIARPANNEQTVDTWQVLAGISGKTGGGIMGFLKNGDWDIFAQTSSGTGKYSGTTIRQDRLTASANATSTTSCPTPTYGGTCMPINFFDPRVLDGQYTAAEYDYLFNNENEGKTVYEQSVFEANITGDVFQIPGAADAVKANFGVHYRNYSINDVPGVETLRNNVALTTTAGITKGEDSVKEVYTEWAIPLVAKKPFVEDLNWTVAYRFTDYDSYDSNETWKSTLSWRLSPEFQVVAISGTSYRAPALYELFLGNQTGFLSQGSIDPCILWGDFADEPARTRCAADGIPADYNGAGSSATIYSGGGAGNLKEENSRSDIFSLIWKPTFANLNIRADLWKIEVSDQIAKFSASGIINACYYDQTGKMDYFCSLFTRDATSHNILTVKDNYVNINVTEVKGIDLKFLYRKEFPFGNLTVDSQHRWTVDNKTGLFSDSELFDYAGTIGEPAYNSQTQFRFDKGDYTYSWTVNAIGPSSDMRFYGSDIFPISATSNYAYRGLSSVKYKVGLEATITHNVSVRYRSDNWTLIGGINNLFDEEPPAISSAIWTKLGNYPLNSQFDPVGRSLFLSVTRRF